MKMEWVSWNAEVEQRCWSETDKSPLDIEDQLLSEPTHEVVFTPVGIYYKESPKRPSTMWQCFMCYTDYDIATNSYVDIVGNVEGVEALKILGKYTFFVGIGKLFNAEKVRGKIDEESKKYVESRL